MNQSTLLDSQAALIGAMLVDGKIAGELFSKVPEDDFTDTHLRSLYQGCKRLYLAGRPVDPVLLASELGEGSKDQILECMATVVSSGRWKSYAAQLREDSTVARLQALGLSLTGCNTAAEGQELLQKGSEIFDRRTGPQRMAMGEGLDGLLGRLSQPERKQQYLRFGFTALDGRVRIYPGKFVILGGYPSSGKTSLALHMAVSMARSRRVGFFSLETDFDAIYNRLGAILGGVNYSHLQDGEQTKDELADLQGVVPSFRNLSLQVEHASRLDVQSLQAAALSQRYEVIFIDYLQLLDAGLRRDATRYEQTTRVSMELHRFAQDRNVAVIGLSQLSRPDKAQKKPRRASMSDLRESGQLEQDADVVMILNRDQENQESEDRLLYIDKNKDGKLGMIRLAFEGETQRFTQRIRQQAPTPDWKPKPRFDPFKALADGEPVPEEFL